MSQVTIITVECSGDQWKQKHTFSSIPELQKMYHIHKGFIFADTMADNGRLSKLTDVINLYLELMSAHRGEVICKVTTAKVGIFKPVYSWIINNQSELWVNFHWIFFLNKKKSPIFKYTLKQQKFNISLLEYVQNNV